MSYKKTCLMLLALTFAKIINVSAQGFHLSTDRPVAGREIPFNYDASQSPLKNLSEVKAVVYYFTDYQWHVKDLPLKNVAKNDWTGKVSTDKNWAFMAFKFFAGDSTDNNQNKSYGTLLLDPTDTTKNLPGGFAAWGLMRSPGYGFEIPDYLTGNQSIGDTVTRMWLSNELLRFSNPVAKTIFSIPYVKAIYNTDQDNNRIEAAIKFLNKSDASEENLLRVRQMFLISNQKQRLDSVANVISTRFPHNNLQKLAAYKAFMNAPDNAVRKTKGEYFLQHFPQKDAISWFDRENMIEYDRVYLVVILTDIKADDFSAIDKYLNDLPFNTLITVYYKTVSISNSRKTISDAFLYPYSVKMIKRMEQFRTERPSEFNLLSPVEWNERFNQAFFAGPYLPVLFSHISICRNIGKYDEALSYARLAQAKLNYKREWLNDDLVFLLNKKGLVKEADEAMIRSMYENQASAEIITMLKQKFIKEHHSEEGFDKYLQSLKNAAASTGENDESEKLLSLPMVDWTMMDVNGKPVSFKSLRGKVVVMDFWATWCVPCKESLPGMNLAYLKYKNDPDVVFYFVDTEETAPDFKKEIRQYVNQKGYTFNVLFDNPNPKGKGTGELFSRVSKAYQISGIPLKLIIDKKGVIRFMTTGYKGSASELSDEISNLIEKARVQN